MRQRRKKSNMKAGRGSDGPRAARVQLQLDLASPRGECLAQGLRFAKLTPAVPRAVYDTFWRFAAKRQELFYHKLSGAPVLPLDDPILRTYKFTNAYRASDRVSQYLVRSVIYGGDRAIEEVFFRVLLFKFFNRIDTWELLERKLGSIRWADYDFRNYDRVLAEAMSRDERIYSSAYIMPPVRIFGFAKKHQNHLMLLERMMLDELPQRISEARSMRSAFELLRSYPGIGDFLAYQYITDLNYSELTSFSEMDFVVPGPGARDGIHKCFSSLGGINESDLIRLVAEMQEEEFTRLGLHFRTLWGRPLQLVDCQNLFCEVDKYARVAHPEVSGRSGRTRIKQLYRASPKQIDYWYPPKWGINDSIRRTRGVT
jgi:alpha-glutamyl/putrescinyl thymine pyrophosphorylase clade 1